MEAHGSFYGIYLWKIRLMESYNRCNLSDVKCNNKLMETMEASTSTDSGHFYVFPWELQLTSMEVNLLPTTSMETSLDVDKKVKYCGGSYILHIIVISNNKSSTKQSPGRSASAALICLRIFRTVVKLTERTVGRSHVLVAIVALTRPIFQEERIEA